MNFQLWSDTESTHLHSDLIPWQGFPANVSGGRLGQASSSRRMV